MSQEVVKGYKQTEIGSIPLDWQLKELRDVCIKIQDGNYGAFYPKSSEFISYGVPFLTSKVLGKAGNINFNKVDYISNEKHKVLLKAHLELNDVLFTNRGASVGAIGYVDARISNGNIGPQLTLLRVNSFVDSLYLFQIMKSSWVQKQILSQDSGSAMNFFGVGATGKFKLPIPDNINEQKIIANILTDVDALICELEKLIAKKQAIKTATMQQLLTGKTRLPQFALRENGTIKGYKQSELEEIPEDWGVKTVYELAEKQKSQFDDGDWVEAEHITDRGIRLIQTGNIGIGQYVEKDTKKYIYPTSFEKLKCKELQKGDLLICRLAEPAGRACIFYNIGEQRVITSVDVTIFRPSSYLADRKFYVQYFSFDVWFKSVLEQVGGTTHKRISRGALGRISVPYPSIQEQTAIATILSDMDSEIQALEKRLVKTGQIKQGMMQELLTGKTRLLQGTVNT
ncbi:restriction endonuclease subunit S [uncultured Acinetobacter sp.]|uniref:restriction endonuclease subunit S n=1 Tax=uncultured Acinetobacter sp. TaxID=165433 RepID=UPI00260FD79B|nr:restriction endonuclease subunit S [uncultured Acinetobacter sp.]